MNLTKGMKSLAFTGLFQGDMKRWTIWQLYYEPCSLDKGSEREENHSLLKLKLYMQKF